MFWGKPVSGIQYGDCYRTVCMEFFLSGHELTFLYELTYLFGSAFETTATSEKEKRKLTLRQQHELSLEPLVSHTIISHLEIHVFSAFFQCLPRPFRKITKDILDFFAA